ncbi:uncharacterized protein LOC101459556 [Ceratitis capitata]|uniref:(Mediterranean fruit fly) hypothetical protein n=1 Tax=Ceratitis capitata TaxID=7213 RepID=W8CDM6_CERCA|nr:uncharacterized protein LOC101459556 [Ceratitis capitata]XP_020717609.1 uncharacterized protein LOC101459556 [Ceratitis capitata]CAD6991843.1 unnamed protein product [Ceratitis capitata]
MSQFQSVPDTGDDLDNESVEVLRARLNDMKRLMSERTAQIQHNPATTEQIWSTKRQTTTGIIDGNFLSVAFGGALLVIASVSVYAFYNLYHAILKKFPSHHEEL